MIPVYFLQQWQRATQLFNTNITALRAIAGSEQVFFEQAVPQLQARGWTFHARVDALRQAHDLAIDYGHGKGMTVVMASSRECLKNE